MSKKIVIGLTITVMIVGIVSLIIAVNKLDIVETLKKLHGG